MWHKNIASRFFGLVTKHACDRQTDWRTDKQNYHSQDRTSIAASRGKNVDCHKTTGSYYKNTVLWHNQCMLIVDFMLISSDFLISCCFAAFSIVVDIFYCHIFLCFVLWTRYSLDLTLWELSVIKMHALAHYGTLTVHLFLSFTCCEVRQCSHGM